MVKQKKIYTPEDRLMILLMTFPYLLCLGFVLYGNLYIKAEFMVWGGIAFNLGLFLSSFIGFTKKISFFPSVFLPNFYKGEFTGPIAKGKDALVAARIQLILGILMAIILFYLIYR